MRKLVPASLALGAALLATSAIGADDPFPALGKAYDAEARPLLAKFCLDCHSTADPEGDLDLERFATLDDARPAAAAWVKVAEMLDDAQMPPEDAPQPSPQERARLREWVRRFLDAEARAAAGDPGPVPLRRLSNAEYTYSVRDLTGVALDPAREFPADGAAGEGFTNAAEALAMSPALLEKYFDAGKEIASHTVPLPDGFRFSPATTRRDWTEEILAGIRDLYHKYAAADGASRVNLQGIQFATNEGGRLPLERYLAALLEERHRLRAGETTIERLAGERALSPRYLHSLRDVLDDGESLPPLDDLRARWRAAGPGDAASLSAAFTPWQNALTRFQSVGHMKPWAVAVDPLAARHEIRLKLPAGADSGEVVLKLVAGDAGDGNAGDFILWERPRLVAPGRPNLLLRDVRTRSRDLAVRRERLIASATSALAAAAEAESVGPSFDLAALAKPHGLAPELLAAWLKVLGIAGHAAADLQYLEGRLDSAGGYDFVKGWGSAETPLLLANSSDGHIRVPGNMKPRAVAVHPSPTQAAAVAWESPAAQSIRVTGAVTHAHSECGNGVAWSLELRRGGTRQRLATGVAAGGAPVAIPSTDPLSVRPGDLVALLVAPRDGNHACDLTDVELTIKADQENGSVWSLSQDVSADILAGNPHADRRGNDRVWHFFIEPVATGDAVIPAGSLLARWQGTDSREERTRLADELHRLLAGSPPADPNHPDAALYQQLRSFSGPLLAAVPPVDSGDAVVNERWGLDPAAFGRHPAGHSVEEASLCLQAPAVLEIRLPADLVEGAEFVTSAVLHAETGKEGSVQVQVVTSDPGPTAALRPDLPVLVTDGSATRKRFERGFAEFRRWFPAALCYTKIVPVDEVITLTLFHREDEPLSRLMLDDAERARLDRLWEELHFISQDALTAVDAFAQLLEYASQDSDPRLFEPFRQTIEQRAAEYRQTLLAAEPRQLESLIAFASRVYRRPLSYDEGEELRSLYRRLREEGLVHDEAFRLVISRLFVSPAFLYRFESAPAGPDSGPVTDWELASRLSYFLWSSVPDDDLRAAAGEGRLRDADVLASQARRMLADARVRRLATEFACQWLQVYEFDSLDEKSERHFPEFAGIRSDLHEEAIRFFEDLFRRDGSLLEILDADHAFLNERLANFYGIPGVNGEHWRRVEGTRQYGRGGVLTLGAPLAKQSGASRTSPTLRGTWISEVLLGEKLPDPPKGVPVLPDEVPAEGLTVRQLVELHASDPSCAGCHVRIDPLGFALERFDAIGRSRQAEADGSPLDLQTTLRDGTKLDGPQGLREYLLTARREAIVRQFCRKLLGYSLGRAVRLSDEPLLEEMQSRLRDNGFRFSIAVDSIVRSPQFREIRGRDLEVAGNP